MKKNILIIIILIFTSLTPCFGQMAPTPKTDANIFGHVVDAETKEHLLFVTIGIRGTTIGTTTDQTGHYRIINAPVGTYILQASFTGYKTLEILVNTEEKKTIEIDFELERDMLRLDEVVVSANRYTMHRTETTTPVNSITPQLFANVQALTLSEGLNFAPGLRMETNCSNCGSSAIRMNGLEGNYSQVLINGRPIFSGLAAVYGLEMIPANMIDRVEVIKGGSSVIYGGNAIAGTINLRLRNPVSNTYEIGTDMGVAGVGIDGSGAPSTDKSMNANVSLVSDDGKTGLAMFGFARDRKAFDANGDGFTEMVDLENSTFGARFYQRLSVRSKLNVDFFSINEDRRGGNRFDYPAHEADIAESLEHRVSAGAITYEQFLGESDLLTIVTAAQNINRNSYFGAERSLEDYGKAHDITSNTAITYKKELSNGNLVFGGEMTLGRLKDIDQGYPDFDNAIIENDSIIEIPHSDNVVNIKQDQTKTGIFAQYEYRYNKLKVMAGARLDYYDIKNVVSPDANASNTVFVPRISMLYDIGRYLQGRLSYARGYIAPQIYDEDLHIGVSGARRVIYENAPGLEQENSDSFMASLDFNKLIGTSGVGFLVEGFYTKLNNPFLVEFGEPDAEGNVINTRSNSEKGASVHGVNFELNYNPFSDLNLSAGFTLQSSIYGEEQDFGEKHFFKTPGSYGYFAMDWDLNKNWSMAANGNFTGSMLVPYFGNTIENPEAGELRTSDPFFDMGLKLNYNVNIGVTKIVLYTGVKNIFNSYQNDFDSGIDRDPSYVYGPAQPRMVYFGVKVGNMLN